MKNTGTVFIADVFLVMVSFCNDNIVVSITELPPM